MDLSGPLQVFTTANELNKSNTYKFPYFDIQVVSYDGGLVKSSTGLFVETSKLSTIEVSGAIVFIIGGPGIKEENSLKLVPWIKASENKAKWICSVCTGAFLLGEAGILNGKKSTTHWAAREELSIRYPNTIVRDDLIFINDGNVWTSAGVSAGIDLSLDVLEKITDRANAIKVAHRLVLPSKRPGYQSQYSPLMKATQNDKEGRFDELNNWITQNLAKNITVQMLAEKMGMSERTFYRNYKKATGKSPADFVSEARAYYSRDLLVQASHSLKVVAHKSGFNSVEQMNNVFKKHFGVSASLTRKYYKTD